MKKFLRALGALCLTCALLLPAALPAHALSGLEAAGAGISSFNIEQVYVNVPEMDVFFYVLDGEGNSVDPRLVRAAGPQLRLGDTVIDTGNIQRANEPICYIFALDNSDRVAATTLAAYRRAITALAREKDERDQIMLYTVAGGVKQVLPATADGPTIMRTVATVNRTGGSRDLLSAAARIAEDIESDFQSLAPRKVIFACTDSLALFENIGLVGGLLSGDMSGLGAEVCTMVATDDADDLSMLSTLSGGEILPVPEAGINWTLLNKVEQLKKALECKTVVDEDFYGTRIENLTLSVPSLGSAVQTTTQVYMGHRLQRPAVAEVMAVDRSHLHVTFNQAVSAATAANPRAYAIQSEDVWGFTVGVRDVRLSKNGLSAVLTTREPLYSGPYSVRLRDVAAAMSSANVSDNSAEFAFRLTGWARDRDFYLARLRVPGIILGVLLLVLIVRAAFSARSARRAEKAAEVEHLLYGGDTVTSADVPPHRWLTLFLRPPGAVAETRWSQLVDNSLLIGSDPAQCELCVHDSRVGAQHCVLALDGEDVLIRPLGEKGREKRVYVNDQHIAGEHRLNNDDIIRIGRTAIRVVL